jgi:vacuolar-type H+-ATPase subunit I/STV1
MRIEKDDNLPSGYRILGSGNCWDVEEDKISVLVSNIEIIPMSGHHMCIEAYGPGPRQIAEDIMELSREIEREELNTLKAENESLKETIEVLQRQLEKERNKNAVKSELEQGKKETVQGVDNDRDALDARTYSVLPIMERANKTNIDPGLYTAMKFIVARYNGTVRENEHLRKRNNKLKRDFESVKGHLRCAQHTLDEYRRKVKHYSEMLVENHPGQSLTFKNAKVSLSSDGTVSVIGESADSLIKRMKELIDTEKKFKEWQSIVLKNLERHITPSERNDIFNEHIKEN